MGYMLFFIHRSLNVRRLSQLSRLCKACTRLLDNGIRRFSPLPAIERCASIFIVLFFAPQLYAPIYSEPMVDFAEAYDRYNDVQNMLLSLSQLQEDRQYVRKFLASNTDSNSEADFEYIDNSITKTMKNVFLSVISSITDPILSGIITVLLSYCYSGLLF